MRRLIRRFLLVRSNQYHVSSAYRMAVFADGTLGYAIGEFHAAMGKLYGSLAQAI